MAQPSFQNPKVIVPKTKKAKSWYRSAVQVGFFLLVALISLNQALKETGITIPYIGSASLHAICPFGGVVSIYEFVTTGLFVQKTHESSFILMIAAFILAIGFGPVICSWVCPLGTFQEWLSILGRRLFGKKYNHFVPSSIDNLLRYLRYIILALVVYVTATTAKLMFQDIDPYYALFNFWSAEVALPSLIILGTTILLSLFIERPWCKYACPYGAVLGLFNLFKIFKIQRMSSSCINCKACDKACPMNIDISSTTTVRNHQCISCMKCTSEHSCPIASTVEFSTKGEKQV
jgi:ferredoxin